MKGFNKIILWSALFCFCGLSPSHATVHEQLAVSTKAMSLGNAVTAYPPGIMAIHYNPAGLSLLRDREFSVGIMYPLKIETTGRFTADPDFEGFMGKNDDPLAGTTGKTTKGAMYVPGMGSEPILTAPNIGASFRKPGSRWTFGFGIYAPYGIGVSVNDFNRDNDNPRRFGGPFIYNQRLVYAAPAVSYQATDTFSVGLSLGFGQTAEGARGLCLRAPNDVVAALDALGKATEGLEIPVVSELTLPPPWFGGGLPTYGKLGQLDFDIRDDFTTSFNVGFLWEPRDWFSFGACYQSEAKSKKAKGTYIFKYSPQWQNFVNWFGKSPTTLVLASIFDLPYSAVSQQTGRIYLEEWVQPQRIQCGVMLRPLKKLRLMCDFHWVNWSAIKRDVFVFDQDIQLLKVVKLLGYTGGDRKLILERHWEDTCHVSYGAEFQLFDWLSLRAGFEPRPSSVPDKYYDLTWPVQDWKIYSGGLGIKVNDKVSVDLGYSYLVGKNRKIPNNKSRIFNSTDFTKIIYNPYAGLNYEQDTEAHLILVNLNYVW